ncbi:alpha/beta hydrolase-fold protein [Sciscionella sediminilitoris]|uniref:alpha/beta hydrolase-fold protein n=1 Tax=Sciscionella sediminilitoris TaxID=1445613 RepID=UPI0004DF57CF
MEAMRAFRDHALDSGVRIEDEYGDERVRLCSFDSAALGRRAECLLVFPKNWHAGYPTPVLYLLHGSDDDPRCWVDKTNLLELAEDTDAILVAPEAGVVGYYTDWSHPDSRGSRPEWERFHLEEVPRRLLGGCALAPEWSVAGISMGGYGALAYAANHPSLFTTAVSLSGLPHITKRFVSAFVCFTLRRQGEPGYAPFGNPRDNSSAWVSRDPFRQAERFRGTALYLAWGDGRKANGDAVFPGSGLVERLVSSSNRSFTRRLDKLGISYTASIGTGTHDWPYWQRELGKAWPFLRDRLSVS